MRKHTRLFDLLLEALGALTKMLFVSMFISTVLVILASMFGLGPEALLIYQLLWGVFWRLCLSLVAIIAIVSMLDSLQ